MSKELRSARQLVANTLTFLGYEPVWQDIFGTLRMVMTQGAWQLGIGLFAGMGAAALLLGVLGRQALQNFLFKVNTLDPWIYGAVAVLLSAVAALACFVPARRATRVNPMSALRAE